VRAAIGADGLIADPDVRAQLVAVLVALSAHLASS
jgi:hypothetical protein